MKNSTQLAELIGPTIIAMTISETLNASIWIGNTAAYVYLNGTLLFVAGLSIVRSHNHWDRHWPITITLSGWIAMLLGLFRMFAPQIQLRAAKNSTFVIAEAMLVLAFGIFITIKAYSRQS